MFKEVPTKPAKEPPKNQSTTPAPTDKLPGGGAASKTGMENLTAGTRREGPGNVVEHLIPVDSIPPAKGRPAGFPDPAPDTPDTQRVSLSTNFSVGTAAIVATGMILGALIITATGATMTAAAPIALGCMAVIAVASLITKPGGS